MRNKKPKPKRAKYYLRQSWNWNDWYSICQVSNNVMVCECSDLNIAELLVDYLNSLPGSVTRHVKAK